MMSSPTGHHTRLGRSTSWPSGQPRQKTPGDLPKPAISLPNLSQQSADVPRFYLERTGPALQSANAAPEVPLWRRNLEGFGPPYDYLGKVKELADGIGSNVYDYFFGEHFPYMQGGCRAFDCRGPGTENHHTWSKRMTEEDVDPLEDVQVSAVESLQGDMYWAERKRETHVLVAEDITTQGIQTLGTALSIDPSFFAAHLRPCELYQYRLPSSLACYELRDLTESFQAFALHHGDYYDQHEAFFDITKTVHIKGILTTNGLETDMIPVQQLWSPTGADRINYLHIYPHISCRKISHYYWVILVDSSPPCVKSEHGPLNRKNMIKLNTSYLPAHLMSGKQHESQFCLLEDLVSGMSEQSLQTVFSGSEYAINHILPLCMTMPAWRHNVHFIEERLGLLRHRAIASPSMETFVPLTEIRRNIVHLYEALLLAKEDATNAFNHCGAEFLQDRKYVEAQYDGLLERAKGMSALLNSEIQLVIGSVTVQDSAIMKRQAKRANLLTILAVIYLPLTLVTGVFGMNVEQINDATPELWACFIGLIVIASVTAGGYFGYWYWRKFHDARESEKREREERMYKIA